MTIFGESAGAFITSQLLLNSSFDLARAAVRIFAFISKYCTNTMIHLRFSSLVPQPHLGSDKAQIMNLSGNPSCLVFQDALLPVR